MHFVGSCAGVWGRWSPFVCHCTAFHHEASCVTLQAEWNGILLNAKYQCSPSLGVLNPLTCGSWCWWSLGTFCSCGIGMAGTMHIGKNRTGKNVPFPWSKGKPRRGITRVWVTMCLLRDSGDRVASCSGARAKSQLCLLLLLVTTPAIQSPSETALANA